MTNEERARKALALTNPEGLRLLVEYIRTCEDRAVYLSRLGAGLIAMGSDVELAEEMIRQLRAMAEAHVLH